MERDERPRIVAHQVGHERRLSAPFWSDHETRDMAGERAIEKAKQLEDALSRHVARHEMVSLRNEIAPFVGLVKAGGVPIGLPAFPIGTDEADAMTLAELKRAYSEFCIAIRDLQTASGMRCR